VIPESSVLLLSYPQDEILDDYLHCGGLTDEESDDYEWTELDEAMEEIADRELIVDMDALMKTDFGDPRFQNKGKVYDGLDDPNLTEIKKVLDFLLDCGIIEERSELQDEDHLSQESTYQSSDMFSSEFGDPGDEDDSCQDDNKPVNPWNPDDRWNETV
jgi:hypothetical protein